MSTYPCNEHLTKVPDRPFKGEEKGLVKSILSSIIRPDAEKAAQGIRSGLSFKKVKRNGGIIFTQWEKTN